MIYLITGSNGAGKTLYSMEFICEHLNKENDRPVYFFSPESQPLNPNEKLGFKPLTLDEVKAWSNLPDGSIIFIDEFRHVFPARSGGQKVPDYVDKLAEHRSRGFDFVLTAQKSTGQFDSAVQGFIEEHRHLIRIKGTSNVRHLVFNAFCSDPLKPSRLLQPDVQLKRLNKKYFGSYKSASIHTAQNRFPYRYFAYLAIAVAVVIGLALYSYKSFMSFGGDSKPIKEATNTVQKKTSSTMSGAFGDQEIITAEEYAALRVPRIPDVPESAPLYDELTKPKSYPRVAACYYHHNANKCSCYSQQATPIDVSKRFCMSFVRQGSFDHAIPDERTGASFHARERSLSQPSAWDGRLNTSL